MRIAVATVEGTPSTPGFARIGSFRRRQRTEPHRISDSPLHSGVIMSKATLVNAAGVEVEASQIEQLRTAHRGALIRPGDADYDSARRIWNASIDKRPG